MLFVSCKKNYELSSLNLGLFFEDCSELMIDFVQTNSVNTSFFDVKSVSSELLFIGIFSEKPEMHDNELTNRDKLIWTWEGQTKGKTKVYMNEGHIETHALDIINKPECINDTLFWVAWGWDSQFRKVLYASYVNELSLNTQEYPLIELETYEIVSALDESELVAAGDLVRLNVKLINSGDKIASDIRINLSSEILGLIVDDIVIKSIEPGGRKEESIVFKLPDNSSYGDQITIKVVALYNTCLRTEEDLDIQITGIDVCLESVALTHIYGHNLLSISENFDLYNLIIFNNGKDTVRSHLLENISTLEMEGLSVEWPLYIPCLPLKLDGIHYLQVWAAAGEASFDNDNFVGNLSFIPLSFLENRDTLVVLQNNQIQCELRFKWGN